MKKVISKVKDKVKLDKNLLLFFIILLLIGIIVGSIFVAMLNKADQALIQEYLNGFLDNIQNNKVDYFLVLKNNLWNILLFISAIWLLGISVIGLPVIVVMFFTKAFILGFSIGSIIFTYKLKGILFALIYVFPGQVISLIACLVLSMYAVSFSMKLIHALVKKKTIDFKYMINRYLLIFLIAFTIVVIMSLYDTYLMPRLVKSIISLIR